MDRDYTLMARPVEMLNYLESRPKISGKIKLDFADFVVREDLGFSPSGCGDHIFVFVTIPGPKISTLYFPHSFVDIESK